MTAIRPTPDSGISASSAMAKSAAFSPRTCASRTSSRSLRHQAAQRSDRRPCAIMPPPHGVALPRRMPISPRSADFIVSAVTASQAVPVAQACAPAVKQDAWYPRLQFGLARRQAACGRPDRRPGRPLCRRRRDDVDPAQAHQGALAAWWRRCRELAPLLVELGFDAKVASEKLGVASAVKMCRSVMIKGLEAMVIESFTTARAYGVEDAVLASLTETFPGIDWEKQGAYFFQRVIEHGRRRSEEVREVAETVREAGLTPWSAQGTAERQAFIADLADEGLFGAKGTGDVCPQRRLARRSRPDPCSGERRAENAGRNRAASDLTSASPSPRGPNCEAISGAGLTGPR